MDNPRFLTPGVLGGALLAAVLAWLVWQLAPALTPFLFAAIVAYIGSPLLERLARAGLGRGAAATLVLLLLVGVCVAVLLVVAPLAAHQVNALVQAVPVQLDWFRNTVAPWVEAQFGVRLDVAYLRDWVVSHSDDVQQVLAQVLPSLTTGGTALFNFLVDLVVALVVIFYFLRDGRAMAAGLVGMVPPRWRPRVETLCAETDVVLGEFLRGQLLVMILMAVYYTAGLWFAGLDYALSVGMIAGLATFVPYLGVVVAAVLGLLTGLLQFDTLTPLGWIAAVCAFGKVLEGYILVPFLVGDRIGLHPVAVIFALVAFGELFGLVGVLLALPASAALLVWLRHVRRRYLVSGLYTG